MADKAKVDTTNVVKDETVSDPTSSDIIKKDVEVEKTLLKPAPASSFTIKVNSKATSYARKFSKAADQPDKTKVPKYVNDIFQKMNIAQNVTLDDGPNDETIDVQPDYRNVFLTLNYHVTKIFQDLSIKDNPLLTPSSLMAYLYALIYGHALISETSCVRNTRSRFANAFTSDDQRRDLLHVLENAYLPPFMKDLLEYLMPTNDPRRSKIQFVHSLAAFLFRYDFGRLYPITMFLKAHTLCASRQANVPVEETLNAWLDSVLIFQNANNQVRVRNLLGARVAVGTYPSTIIEAAETLFNPVTQRTQSQRPVFTRLQTFPYQVNIDDNINAYIYALGADEDNVVTSTTFIENMSKILKQELGCTETLGSAFDLTCGTGIQNHYYSTMSFPTWHSSNAQPNDAIITADAYAQNVGFMIEDPLPANRLDLEYPDRNVQNFNNRLYLRNGLAGPYDRAHDPDRAVLFTKRAHVLPDVLHFNPWDYVTSSIQYNVLNGIHIETDNISGFTVPTARATDPLIKTNSQFLNSAIPASKIIPAYLQNADNPFISFPVDIGHEDTQCVRMSRGIMYENRLPYFDADIPIVQNEPLQLQGFHQIPHIGRFKRCSNTTAFKHGTVEDNETSDQMTNPSINAWSSYRYINTKMAATTARNSKISFILDFRPLYGTNVTMARSINPFVLIPKA